LDLRYEGFRLKQPSLEERLLGSIAQRGIEEPLEGVQVKERGVLLNGFKRHRCARKLRLATVPYISLGSDEAAGILSLLRTSNHRSLSILEQAAFIDELKTARQMSVAQLSVELSRSKAWVSVRLGLIAQMTVPKLLSFNGQLVGAPHARDFYFDPHTKHYTGRQNVLKGWCANIRWADKVLHSDFFHTAAGDPVYLECADNYQDMRERFAALLPRLRQDLGLPAEGVLTFVLDRGIFSQEVFA